MDNDNFFNSNAADIIQRFSPEAEENRSKRLSFLLGILGGLCSGVLPYILDKLFSLW